MGTITQLKQGKRNTKRVNVYIDGRFALALKQETVIKDKLKIGGEITAERVAELIGKDSVEKAMDTAVRFLGYRPRSEAEIRKKLLQRGFNEDIIDKVITKLKGQGLVDDAAFVRFWKENRENFSPRSSRLTRLELKQKGVSDEIIDTATDNENDEDNAYKAAQSKIRRMTITDYATYRQRLGEYLKRRGFSYGVINKTIARIWQERTTENPA